MTDPRTIPPVPVAPRVPTATVLHGETLADDYAWLRDRASPAVRAYLEAENGYADAVLAPLRPLEQTLYAEMLGRIKQTDLSVPYRDGPYWYYSRTEEGRQYPIHCRRQDLPEAPEEVLLDLNAMAEGHSYMGIGAFAVSPDGRRLAYSTDTTGFRDYTLRIKDLDTGADLIEPVPHAGSVGWCADSDTFYYAVEDETTKRDYRLYRNAVLAAAPTLVYEEPDERFQVFVTRTRSRRFLVVYLASHFTSEVRTLDLTDPAAEWRQVLPRIQDREYDLEHDGDRFVIRINDRGRNFRVVSVPIASPGEDWIELLPHRDDVMVEGVDCFRDHWVVWERADGLPRILVTTKATGTARHVDFPEGVYDASPGMNMEWDQAAVRYRYESFVTATSVYDYHVATGESRLLKRQEVLGDYDPARYRSDRMFAIAADGTRIPISVVRRRDVALPGTDPTYLTGYGAYGIPYPVSFNSNRLSLLDRGVTFAVAHIRGGGEMGRGWHDAGRLAEKMNTFTDFISCAEHLFSEGVTEPGKLVIEGGSAGGLLMGAVLNLRPDLCAGALLQVPFVDVINTMRDASLPLTVGEYEEWGNPMVAEEYRWLRAYCPYTNLASRRYPAMLVRTSLNDSQVMFWEPAKYVAKMRTLDTGPEPLLLVTNLGAGHSGASGRYDRLREIASDYAFVLWRLGVD